jgi:hypothetical protein
MYADTLGISDYTVKPVLWIRIHNDFDRLDPDL